jgi:hypothetical protein
MRPSQPTRPLPPQDRQDEPMDNIDSSLLRRRRRPSERTQPPPQGTQDDEPMDVDPAAPATACPSLSLSSAPRGLPFPGKLVDGVHEVVWRDL